MENGKVEGQSESDGVGGFQFSVGDFGCGGVGFQSSVLYLFMEIINNSIQHAL